MLLWGFFNAQCNSTQHGRCNSLTAMDFAYMTSKMRQSAIIIRVRASLRWCERCCFSPGNTFNYIIYVHAIHRKERSQCYNAGSLLNKYNLLKNKHAKSSSGSYTHIPACTCTHTAHTHTHFVISKRGGRKLNFGSSVNNNIHQSHTKPWNNSSSTRAQFEYRAFTTMVPI